MCFLQERNLASAEDNLIAAHAAYAKDRAGLYQVLAATLQHYGINLPEAASGEIKTAPVVPGVAPAPPGKEPSMTPAGRQVVSSRFKENARPCAGHFL